MSEEQTKKTADKTEAAPAPVADKPAASEPAKSVVEDNPSQEVPDRVGMRSSYARAAESAGEPTVHTGDTSAVHPYPDAEAPGRPHPITHPVGERQVTEQPDFYASLGATTQGAPAEAQAKKPARRGGRRKKGEAADGGESKVSETLPAQFDAEDDIPAQWSY